MVYTHCGVYCSAIGHGQYSAKFLKQSIGGPELVTLSTSDLRSIGVPTLGHQKAILAQIAGIQQSDVSVTPSFFFFQICVCVCVLKVLLLQISLLLELPSKLLLTRPRNLKATFLLLTMPVESLQRCVAASYLFVLIDLLKCAFFSLSVASSSRVPLEEPIDWSSTADSEPTRAPSW